VTELLADAGTSGRPRHAGGGNEPGRWTFQLVEEYDDDYYTAFKEHERRAREELMGGKRHVFEAEMKQERRTHGRAHHEATPADLEGGDARG
jgi:hypothetical protein